MFRPDRDLVVHGDNLGCPAAPRERLVPARVPRSAVQHGTRAAPRPALDDGVRGRRPDRLRRPPLRHHPARLGGLRRRLRRLPRVPRAAAARAAPAARRPGDAVPAPRLPRGARLQAAARRPVRAGLLPQRDRLGLRLRRRARAAAGPPSTTRSWSTSRIPEAYFFDAEAVDREPYMAPGLVTPEKAARGKLPTDVWWHTIVPTSGREQTGYPTQKPEGVLRRIVQASSAPGDWCLDSVRRQRHPRRRRARRSGGASCASTRAPTRSP